MYFLKNFLIAVLVFFTATTAQAEPSNGINLSGGYIFSGSDTVNSTAKKIKLNKNDSLTKTCDDGTIVSVTANVDNGGTVILNNDGSITIKPATADAVTAILDFDTVVHNYTKIDGTITISNNKVSFSNGTKVAGNVLVMGMERPFHYEISGGTGSLELSAISNRIIANKGANLTGEVNNAGTLVFKGGGSAFIQVDAGRTFHNAYLTEGITLTSAADEYHFVLEKIGSYNLNGLKIDTTAENTVIFLINHDTVSFKADSGIICNGYTFDGDSTVKITCNGKNIGSITLTEGTETKITM